MNSSPRRPAPPPPLGSPSDVQIEDKYYVGLSGSTMSNNSSPGPAKLQMKQPPSELKGEALSQWYKDEASRLYKVADLSQQRNQMLVQKVLEMRSNNNSSASKGGSNVSSNIKKGSSSNGTKTTSTATISSFSSTSSSSSSSSSSPATSRLLVRELDDSPMHHTSLNAQLDHDDLQQGTMNDLAWTELKLQRSHHNFHALSKRTREVETSNAKAAQMIVDLRHELEVSRVREDNASKREQEGRALVSQLSKHVESLKRQNDVSNEKIHVYERVKNEAEDRATKWRKERREIGGYALRLEKEQGTFKHCVRYLFPLFNFN
jgi:hypothetical protein